LTAAITITGKDGKPILYASMNGEHLRFEFEYYARDDTESDYEFSHTVFPADFPSISKRFALLPTIDILLTIQELQDMGLGRELKDALTENEIVNELFVWTG
jgi:hypothetical protein